MKTLKMILLTLVASMLVLTGCGQGGLDNLTPKQAKEQVDSYVNNGDVKYTTVSHDEDTSWVGTDTTADELPDIDKYPLSVRGEGDIVVEIASSTEKANVSQERWLDQMARKFNASGATVGGKRIAISVRPIASGMALDYITSRKYVPNAYSPSNELWAPMIKSSGMRMELVEQRLTGNAAGILMTQEVYDNFIKTYGEITVPNAVKAVLAGDLKLAHTDPNQSSTGLNFLTQELLALDSANPLSAQAVKAYQEFRAKVPAASPTTDELSQVASKGFVNAAIMEAQAWKAAPSLATGWVFTPLGARHDSPLYAMDGLNGDKLAALKQFSKFSLSADAQASASQFGFNQYNDYKYTGPKLSAAQLIGSLKLWKENKDSGVPVVSMFVLDRSTSMGNNKKMENAKKAVRIAGNYVNPNNYIGLISYASDITLDLPIGKFTDQQHNLLTGAINDDKLQPGGNTATNSAIIAALHHMLQFTDANLPGQNVKFRIILVSDGETTEGLSLNRVLPVINGLGVPVYGVSFETDSTLDDMKKMAGLGESGAYVITADTEDAASKLKALARAAL